MVGWVTLPFLCFLKASVLCTCISMYIYLFSGNGADGFTLVQVNDECWDDSTECVSVCVCVCV